VLRVGVMLKLMMKKENRGTHNGDTMHASSGFEEGSLQAAVQCCSWRAGDLVMAVSLTVRQWCRDVCVTHGMQRGESMVECTYVPLSCVLLV
jgi:hypothetical protein